MSFWEPRESRPESAVWGIYLCLKENIIHHHFLKTPSSYGSRYNIHTYKSKSGVRGVRKEEEFFLLGFLNVELKGRKKAISSAQTTYIHTMTYYTTTTLSSINFSQLTTLYHIENQNVTLHPIINITTTLNPLAGLPPTSPYSFTEKIIIGIIAVFLVLCTVIGNFMVCFSTNKNHNSSHLHFHNEERL